MDIMREQALRLDGLIEYRGQECDGVDFAAVLENDPDDIDTAADDIIPDFVAALLRDPDEDVYTPPQQSRTQHMPHTQQSLPQPQIYFLNAVPVSPMPLPVATFQVSMMFRVA